APLYTPYSPLSLHDALPIYTIVRPGAARHDLELVPRRLVRDPFVRECLGDARLHCAGHRVQVSVITCDDDEVVDGERLARVLARDRKSTRLNSSHVKISYAV